MKPFFYLLIFSTAPRHPICCTITAGAVLTYLLSLALYLSALRFGRSLDQTTSIPVQRNLHYQCAFMK